MTPAATTPATVSPSRSPAASPTSSPTQSRKGFFGSLGRNFKFRNSPSQGETPQGDPVPNEPSLKKRPSIKDLFFTNDEDEQKSPDIKSDEPSKKMVFATAPPKKVREAATLDDSSLVGAKEKSPKICYVCNKGVFPMEELKADDMVFHKSCFR
jgi:hypothetical protein